MHRLDNKRQYVFDSEEEKQELIQDILSGMYYKEIEVKYDVNEKSIRNLCMRENINVTKLRKKSKEYRTAKSEEEGISMYSKKTKSFVTDRL